jgi:glycerophosphoryl diester phosphodiesterase
MSQTSNRFLALLRSRGDRPAVVAHRGDSFHAPENTLEAARLARLAGADAWELDVQLTRDGVPILLHDESLVRTTNVASRFSADPRARTGFRLSDFDLEEIQALDAGSWFVAGDGGSRSALSFGTLGQLAPGSLDQYRSGQITIPTLADALRLTSDLDWLVNVEIKSFPDHPAGVVERVLDVIRETGTASRALISSFDHHDVAAANRPGRDYALGILTMTPLYHMHKYATELVGADAVCVSAEVLGSESIAYRRHPAARSLRGEFIADLTERQVPILAYTINDHGPDRLADHLASIGVAGLFTDDPRGLKNSFSPGAITAQRGPR